jgi:hypothetical protein
MSHAMRVPIRSLMVWALFAVGCAYERASMPTRPASSAEQELAYRDALDIGTAYATQRYEDPEFHEAEQLSPNLWRVRFGLAPKGSGRVVDLHVDGSKGAVIRSDELTGVGAKMPIPK